MSGALVVGAAPVRGREDFYRELLAEADAVVAADAAGEWCVALGRVPDVVVGDFDSAEPGAPHRLRALGADLEIHPADKDASDLDLAASRAVERFGRPIVLTASFSGRFDHTLASIGTLVRAGPGARAIEPGWRAWAVHPRAPVDIPTRPGGVFGVIAPAGAGGVDVQGGRWTLRHASLEPLDSMAISNEATGDAVHVSCRSGALVVFITEP